MSGFRVLELLLAEESKFNVENVQSTTPDQVVDQLNEFLVGHVWFSGSKGTFSRGIRI